MKKIRKAIIPAAGLGTRFLPATKAMPKEMLPIVDKPTIQYIVEEAIASGIEDIIIVTGKGKRAIEDHFDNAPELELTLANKGKHELLKEVQYSSNLANIHYIRQKEPKGLGHAIWCARHFVGDEPFAVLLGDDIVQSETPCLKQLINEYELTRSSVIGVQTVPEAETPRYGIVDPVIETMTERRAQIRSLVEKPALGTAPSTLAIMGRYILTPEVFLCLDKQQVGAGGEIQLTDALQELNLIQRVFAYNFEGKRYDVGEKLGFVLTQLEFALEREDLRDDLLKKMKEYVGELVTK
ncbi:UTP--glucose-1-phosphate uridylyltransferase GalU [Aureibacillus halotolerans]|uniref:UTP--glucose-1-phosphate uridylyltransferase n=1 Tax=Aureibacillus halotolerans TaxID=1508390 RepID=A0A4R6TWL3_9BACI|nr:UTP--glucose-1-phosphate uridylyltransferase GalU [Aureibacillus halotolerans]TDQ37646.1 UDP-glucose pyrophosphorylase [Aureibacillus halotolerans]